MTDFLDLFENWPAWRFELGFLSVLTWINFYFCTWGFGSQFLGQFPINILATATMSIVALVWCERGMFEKKHHLSFGEVRRLAVEKWNSPVVNL